MMVANQADAEDEYLAVRVAMLRQYPQMDVHCNLLDAHFYVFAKWVVDYILNSILHAPWDQPFVYRANKWLYYCSAQRISHNWKRSMV